MKKVLSFTMNDFADLIKDNAGRGRKSLSKGRRMAFAVISKLNTIYKILLERLHHPFQWPYKHRKDVIKYVELFNILLISTPRVLNIQISLKSSNFISLLL